MYTFIVKLHVEMWEHLKRWYANRTRRVEDPPVVYI